MSSPRSRSGGRRNWTTLRRWNRSSRNWSSADGLDDVAVGGGDEAHVDPQFLRAAHAGEAAVLEEAQQLGLERPAHVADFVQEDGAAVGFLDAAGFLLQGAGEGAFFVAEQLAFQQRFGDGGAVDADVAGSAARWLRLWSAPATSSLPVPLSPRISTVASVGATVWISCAQFAHLRGFADDLVEAVGFAGAGAQGGVFLEQPVALGAAGDGVEQFLGREGFGEVIDGARP